MIGAGGQAGQNDAANLLKPALARGELRTIAATTWAEYKKYFEKDAALARRFQVVKVEEPTEAVGIIMMRGLAEPLEKHHKVRDPRRGRRGLRPALAPLHLGSPAPRQVRLRPRHGLRAGGDRPGGDAPRDRGRAAGDRPRHRRDRGPRARGGGRRRPQQRLGELAAKKAAEEEKLVGLKAQWDKERDLIGKIREVRSKLEELAAPKKKEADAKSAGPGAKPAAAAAAPPRPRRLLHRRRTPRRSGPSWTPSTGSSRQLQGETPLMQACVNSQTIAEVISGLDRHPGREDADGRDPHRPHAQGPARAARHRPVARPRGDRQPDPDRPREPHGSAPADRRLPARRAERRRQDRDRPDARRDALRRRAEPHHDQHVASTRRRTRSRRSRARRRATSATARGAS